MLLIAYNFVADNPQPTRFKMTPRQYVLIASKAWERRVSRNITQNVHEILEDSRRAFEPN